MANEQGVEIGDVAEGGKLLNPPYMYRVKRCKLTSFVFQALFIIGWTNKGVHL